MLLKFSIYLLTLDILFAAAFNETISEDDRELTSSQKAILEEFKIAVRKKLKRTYVKEDFYLIRWLRAKNFDINDAKDMMYRALRWRRENSMDNINKEDWGSSASDYPLWIDGVDKGGRPIISVSFGSWNVQRAAMQLTGNRFSRLKRWVDKMYEDSFKKIRQLRANGKNVTQFYFLANLDNFNLLRHGCLTCFPLYTEHFTNTYERYYPLSGFKAILFNAPADFEMILALTRPLMSATTQRLMHVYGSKKSQWEPEVLNDIDPDQIRAEFGGTKQ